MNQPLVNGKATKTDYIDSFDVVKKEGYIIAIDKHSPSLKFYFFNIHYCYYYGYVGICHECNLMIGYADYKDDLIEILEKQYSNDFCFPFLDDTKENPIESYQSCFASEFSTYKELNGVWKEIFNKADLSPCASNKTTKLYLINNQLFQLRNNKLRLLPRRNLASLKEEYPNISEELFQMEKKKNPRIHFKERLALSQ